MHSNATVDKQDDGQKSKRERDPLLLLLLLLLRFPFSFTFFLVFFCVFHPEKKNTVAISPRPFIDGVEEGRPYFFFLVFFPFPFFFFFYQFLFFFFASILRESGIASDALFLCVSSPFFLEFFFSFFGAVKKKSRSRVFFFVVVVVVGFSFSFWETRLPDRLIEPDRFWTPKKKIKVREKKSEKKRRKTSNHGDLKKGPTSKKIPLKNI